MSGSESSRVTVAIPTRNRARLLGGAIQSVLDQTYQDFVLVVSDNASTDDTAAVVASFDDPRVHHRLRPDDIGMVANHNRCLEEMDTEYGVIFSDDDRLLPDMLERTITVLDHNPRVGLVHGTFHLIDGSGGVVSTSGNWTGGLVEDTIEPGPVFIRESMRWACRVCASTALMRVAAFTGNNFQPADFPPIDLGCWLRLALDWDIAFLGEPLGEYRIHDQTHSAAFGSPVPGGYILDIPLITALRAVKERFIDCHGDRLNDPAELRRLAGESMRRELVIRTKNLTHPDRLRRPTARLLWQAVKLDPLMAIQPEAWRTMAVSLVGGRARGG